MEAASEEIREMRTGIRLLCIAVVVIAVVAVSRAPHGPTARPTATATTHPTFPVGAGRGSEIGVSVRDVEPADIAREKLSGEAGAVIEKCAARVPQPGPA